MKAVRKITPQNARRLAISRQQLVDKRPEPTKQGIMELFRELGCVQIDPIRAVERTQYLVLWSRLGKYKPADLDVLIFQERDLFEYWAHAASIVLTEDYPLYRVHMRDWLLGDKPWQKRTRDWLAENEGLRRYMLDELQQNGPLSSRDFKDHSQKTWESGGWTSGQNVSLMLGSLWRLGTITISHRKGLTKFYDLTERVLPAVTNDQELSWAEVVYDASQRSLRALGIARPEHIEQHFTRERYPHLLNTLERLESEDRVIPVSVQEDGESWPGDWYIHAGDLPLLEAIERGEWQPRTTLLSPFDNLICDRDRTEQLFNFYFRIEIYVPAKDRQYGYYVMPVLHGDRLIGRFDLQMDRKAKKLAVLAAYQEESVTITKKVTREVQRATNDLATFVGAKDVEYAPKARDGWPGIG